jgi:hypothetical protein
MMRDVRQTALVFIVGVGIGKVIWSAPKLEGDGREAGEMKVNS